MKEHTKWIYQQREVNEPWAIRVCMRKTQRLIEVVSDIYADYLPTKNKSISVPNVYINQNITYIYKVGNILTAYEHPLDEDDIALLDKELTSLKESFLD